MFLKQSGKTSISGILSLPYCLLIIFLINEANSFIVCHGGVNLEVGEKKILFNEGYNELDTESTRCTWDFNSPEKSHFELNCTVNLPSETCTSHSLDVYTNFIQGVASLPDMYCGFKTFTTKSSGNSLRIVHRRELQNLSGNFTCNIEAV
ncbi:uncharacterized protein LOC122513034 isoform X2 [Leptopilina heterotoma]|uniref:uncharacterized protein LOC122513034 isoform X2 n=1 Tax=Leptopilina heterotoma TaxID=63436 RepID=UPI001CAA26B7|nr:uncharacterized protein LOC122513034 isoform X2 [Leptopilina heterotoma]